MTQIQNKRLMMACEINYYRRKLIRKFCKKLHIKQTQKTIRYGRNYISLAETQDKIYNMIMSGQPMMVGRCGVVEAFTALQALQIEMGIRKEVSKKYQTNICINAGFFPVNNENLVRFAHLIEDGFRTVDILGSMVNNNEEYFVRSVLPDKAIITDLGNLEPYYSNTPWTKALLGKKVLVIHPFAESIKQQYSIREKLFENENILPEFELHVLKAVQSIGGTKTDYATWFDALDYMYSEALKIDFDVAIIGCGAYGFPLAAKIKKAGKQAIHLGGAVQILFGIWGSRWENNESIRRLKNKYWIRPSENEKPENLEAVENGCYW